PDPGDGGPGHARGQVVGFAAGGGDERGHGVSWRFRGIGSIRIRESGTIKGQFIRFEWGQSRAERPMYLELDGEGPLHAQLTRALKAMMLSGLGDGTRLPPTRLLAQELGMSRNTVLAAYEQLRAEGFIDARTGSGSYVAQPLPSAPVPLQPAQGDIGPQSVRARRMRDCHDHSAIPGRAVPGAVHSFQYGVPMTNPALTTAWARELSRAAQYTPPNYPP